MSADNSHWLSTMAQRAGLGDSSEAGLTDTTSISEAWQTVANSLGTSQAEVARAVADALHLPLADLASADPDALTFLPEGPALAYGVLPLRATDRELIVATSNPLDFDAEREIGFLSSRRTVFEVASPDELSPASKRAYGKAADAKEALAREEGAAEAEEEAVAAANAAVAAAEAAAAAVEEAAAAEAAAVEEEPAAAAEAAELEIVAETEVIRAESFDQEVMKTEWLVNGEDVTLARDGGLRAFTRSLLRAPLGVLRRLRALMGLRTESSDSWEPAGGTIPLEIEAETESIAEEPSEPHILIVDDSDGDRLVMRTILMTNGFAVSQADDGSTALPFLDDVEGIDAVLLDLKMKEMDGLETLKVIRKSKRTRALPVVILTGSTDPEDERQLLRAGADDYLKKPVDPLQLINRIRAVLKRAQC